jgi:hypothetical protein
MLRWIGRRQHGAAEAQADVTAEHLVLRAQRLHVVQMLALGQRGSHVQGFRRTDALSGTVRLDELIERADADGLEHLVPSALGIGADVTLLVGDEVAWVRRGRKMDVAKYTGAFPCIADRSQCNTQAFGLFDKGYLWPPSHATVLRVLFALLRCRARIDGAMGRIASC